MKSATKAMFLYPRFCRTLEVVQSSGTKEKLQEVEVPAEPEEAASAFGV